MPPILVTSVATVAGHFPLLLVTGPGAAARNSIGWVLVTGMIIGTCFTLFVVPSFYLVLARDHRKDGERLSKTVVFFDSRRRNHPRFLLNRYIRGALAVKNHGKVLVAVFLGKI